MDIGVRATIFSGVAPSTIFYSGFYYNFNDNFRFKVNMGKSYRLPSFTELYYNSPANHGNSNLLSETNYNYETSLVYLFGKHSLELNVFYRNQSNSIDWVKFMDGKGETTRYWEAVNIKKNDNAGFEFLHNIVFDNILFNYGIEKIFSIDYYKNLLSKYGLRYPDFIIKFNVSYPIIDKLRIIANYNYKTINDTDIKGHYLNLKLNLTVNKIKIALKINNVFNTAIEEIPGVKIPGRWAYIQISYNL
jgi:iron complex outermembrane receptor protein